MTQDFLENIYNLLKRKVKNEQERWYFFDHFELLDWIYGELDEVKEEIKSENSVFLEDELADVFWTYMRLLYSLEQEKKISIENVFQQVEEKFQERIQALENGISWEEIKGIQKEKREMKHKMLYKK